jgi:DUF971 family protein
VTIKDPRIKPVAIRSPRGARTTEIDWADGHKGIYPHAVLRGFCPCAGCQGHTGEIRRIETRNDQLELDDLQPVGGYALSLTWFDGHNSGIYSYKYLRSLCQCPQCLPDAGTAAGSLPRS